jgi:hypothetical protein
MQRSGALRLSRNWRAAERKIRIAVVSSTRVGPSFLTRLGFCPVSLSTSFPTGRGERAGEEGRESWGSGVWSAHADCGLVVVGVVRLAPLRIDKKPSTSIHILLPVQMLDVLRLWTEFAVLMGLGAVVRAPVESLWAWGLQLRLCVLLWMAADCFPRRTRSSRNSRKSAMQKPYKAAFATHGSSWPFTTRYHGNRRVRIVHMHRVVEPIMNAAIAFRQPTLGNSKRLGKNSQEIRLLSLADISWEYGMKNR